jgi:HAD superfamily hydrolase (TIGR01509 family)
LILPSLGVKKMPLDIPRIQALCFDVDGTLRDTDDQYVRLLADALRPARPLFPRQDLERLARRLVMAVETPGTYLFGLTDRLEIDRMLAVLGDRLARLRSRSRSRLHPMIHGTRELLAALAGRYPLAIVSARGERSTLAFLEEHELERYFQVVVSAQTCRHTKPFPEPLIYAAARMRVPPQSCLMVGDTTVDIRAGRLAGAQTVGVLSGFGEAGELVREGADLILNATPYLQSHLAP